MGAYIPGTGEGIGQGLDAGALGTRRWVWLEYRVQGEVGRTPWRG